MHPLTADILKAIGTLLIAAGLVYGAYRYLRVQSARDRAADAKRRANQPPVTLGGSTDGSEEDDRPRRRPQAR